MPRTITDALKQELYAPRTGEMILMFATIDHTVLIDPVRVVNDIKDYVLGTNTYTGCPFNISLVSDGERAPRAVVTIQNVDRRIGEIVTSITTPPSFKLQVFSSLDFDLTVDPRVESTPPATVEYEADFLFLREIRVTSANIQGELTTNVFTSEPWPSVRATKDRLPGLFR